MKKNFLEKTVTCRGIVIFLVPHLGAELAKLLELDLAGAVLVDLGQNVHQLLLAGPEAHGAQNLVQVVRGQELCRHLQLRYCRKMVVLTQLVSALHRPEKLSCGVFF